MAFRNISVLLEANTAGFTTGMRRATSTVDEFGRRTDSTGRSVGRASNLMSNSFRSVNVNLRSLATGAAALKLADVLRDSVNAASDLSETQSKVRVVFGAAADEVLRFGSTSAVAMGQSQQQAEEAAATFGNLFVAMKIGQGQAADMSTHLVQLASDLASFNNTDPGDALEALRSGLVGETEPLRRYGVNLQDATLRQRAMELGLGAIGATLTPLQRAQAAYSLIVEQTATAQGDFARTSAGAANQQRILTAQWQDAEAKLGVALLPALIDVTHALNDDVIPAFVSTVQWVERNGDVLKPLAVGLVTLAASWKAYTLATRAAAAANIYFAGTAVAATAAGTGTAAAGVVAPVATAGRIAGAARVLPVIGAGVLAYEGTSALLHGLFGSRFGADSVKPTAELGPATQQLVDQYGSVDAALAALRAQNHGAAGSQNEVSGAMDRSSVAARNLAGSSKLVAATTQATATAFSNAFDVGGQFDPDQAAQSIAAAQQTLLDAQRAARQEQERIDAAVAGRKGHDGPTVSEEQQLADARRRVADATTALSKAQADAATTGDLGSIYRQNTADARAFVRNIHDAIDRGLNPANIVRLLEEGPERAGAELDALVADHSGRLIQLANASAQALTRISRVAVRQAQFTATAIGVAKGQQERYAKDLPKALELDTALRNMKKPDLHELADRLGIGHDAVARIAEEFGIDLPRNIQRHLNQHPVHVVLDWAKSNADSLPKMWQDLLINPTRKAAGGFVDGPGTSTSDSIPALLSRGEWVMKAKAVDYYGANRMAALNAMQLPRFADGGMWGTARPITGGGGGGSAAVVVHHHHHHEKSTSINVGEVRAHDYRDFRRQMDAEVRARRAVSR